MKLKQMMGIFLISIFLLSINAIAAPADSITTDYSTADYSTADYSTADYSTADYTTADYTTADYTTTDDTRTDNTTRDNLIIKSDYIATPTFKADFTATHHPYRPLTIKFTQKCIGEPVPHFWGKKYGLMTYFWGFGDKTTSILENPEHPFKKPGKYKVYLQIKNAEGEVSRATKVINVEW